MPIIMEGVLRAAFAFVVLLIIARLVGRHNDSGLSFFELITGVAIGGMGALMAADANINIWGVFSALLTFMALLILNGYVSLDSRPLRKLPPADLKRDKDADRNEREV